jgi:hypothetical protein
MAFIPPLHNFQAHNCESKQIVWHFVFNHVLCFSADLLRKKLYFPSDFVINAYQIS